MQPRVRKARSPAEVRKDRIIERRRAIPNGRVRTYDDIDPRYAAPGRAHSGHNTREPPGYRVVRADGSAAMGAPQLERLRREGIPMRGDRVDLSQARIRGY